MNSKNTIEKYLEKVIIIMFLITVYSCSSDSSEDVLDISEAAVVSSVSAKSSNSVMLSYNGLTASTEEDENPIENIDDNGSNFMETRWSGLGTAVNVIFDFGSNGSETIVDYINIAFLKSSERAAAFTYWSSDDGSSWVYKGKKSSSGTSNEDDYEEFDLSDCEGRYFRIKFQGNSLNEWNSVYDIELFGTGSEAEVSDTSVEISENIVDFGDLEVETSWISEDTGDRDSFDAVDVDGEDWMDVYNSGVVMMKCLAADSHRTELKEKSGDEAVLTKYKKMYYEATLTSIPSHGVTIAQVHNRTSGIKRPWIRVYVDADRYIKIKETLTTPWQTSEEGGSTYSTWVGPKYTSGNQFSVEVLVDNGSASFEIITDGETEGTTLTPYSDWDDYSAGYYLKAGVYTEGDDLQPQIKFNSFSVEY